MNTVVPLKANVDWSPAQLKLAKHTVAKDSNDDEFNLFIHTCRATGLDPLRKQAYLWVFNKDKPKFRRMVIVTAIGGYRSIAARTGNYRPNDDTPEFEYDPTKVDPLANPKGLVKAVETVWQFAHGQWFKVRAEARWDAYAPILEQPEGGWRYEETGEYWEDSNKPKTRKVAVGEIVRKLDPDKARWRVDPEGMLAKCAEALALRKAWPDDFAGVHSEDEMDKAHSEDKFLDLTATEIVNQVEVDEKLDRMGGKNALTVDWPGMVKLERVPEGAFCERALEWLGEPGRSTDDAEHWWKRNEAARAEYKARHGGEYLEFQKAWEKQVAGLGRHRSSPDESVIKEREQAVIERLRERLAECASLADVEQLEADARSTIDKLSEPRKQEAMRLINSAKGGDA